jgi:hypothetical protein
VGELGLERLGVLLGGVWVIWIGPLATQALLLATLGSLDVTALLLGGVVAPLAALLFTFIGPSLVFVGRQFRHALDGFTFGAASALGFTFAVTSLAAASVVGEPPSAAPEPLSFALDIVRRGLLAPVVAASLTGLAGASFWLHRQPAGLRQRCQQKFANFPGQLREAFARNLFEILR